jgi:hypothetical protein
MAADIEQKIPPTKPIVFSMRCQPPDLRTAAPNREDDCVGIDADRSALERGILAAYGFILTLSVLRLGPDLIRGA